MVNCSDINCYKSVNIPHQALRIQLSLTLCEHTHTLRLHQRVQEGRSTNLLKPVLRAACFKLADRNSHQQQQYRVGATEFNLLGIAVSFFWSSSMLGPQPQWLTCPSSCSETATEQAFGWAWSPLDVSFMELSSKTLTVAFAWERKVCILEWHLRQFIIVT